MAGYREKTDGHHVSKLSVAEGPQNTPWNVSPIAVSLLASSIFELISLPEGLVKALLSFWTWLAALAATPEARLREPRPRPTGRLRQMLCGRPVLRAKARW